jgi:hypothetical protein
MRSRLPGRQQGCRNCLRQEATETLSGADHRAPPPKHQVLVFGSYKSSDFNYLLGAGPGDIRPLWLESSYKGGEAMLVQERRGLVRSLVVGYTI